MKKQHHNVVILGTSPLAITEAVWQKSHGKSVLNIDDKEIAGGAWTTIEHEGIPAVEIGCHIWEVEKGATDFLDAFFNLDLVPLKPQPRIVKKRFSIPYDWKINLTTGKYVISKLIRFRFKELKAGLTSPARTFTFVPRKYLYPKGGANELHTQMMGKIQSNDLNISLNTELRKVKINDKGVELELKNGNKLLSDQLILSSLSSIEKIEFEDGSSILPETKRVDYIHVHLLLKTDIPRDFSYERWMDDEYIHRVSDMTSQVSEELQPNEKLLCVGIHATSYHASSQKILLEEILSRLKSRKLIEQKADLIQHGFNVFPSYYTDPTKLSEIEKRSNGKISVLRSTSFTYSFFNQAGRYKQLTTSDKQQS
ncbi:MAG: hypothetical protein COA38_02235 [Fluviicola sp.]|nr:MAG: hypothetical protein COA38_02235 [Fluviicola sp.]